MYVMRICERKTSLFKMIQSKADYLISIFSTFLQLFTYTPKHTHIHTYVHAYVAFVDLEKPWICTQSVIPQLLVAAQHLIRRE